MKRILYETERYELIHVFELTYLIDKTTRKEIFIGDFYGDPSCGLIDKENKWCIVGGDRIVIWGQDEIFEIAARELSCAFELRQIKENTVQVLIDPWSDYAAIWEIDVLNKIYVKICDFNKYNSKEYQGDVEW